MKTCNKWAGSMHQYGWKFLFGIWENRNSQLHDTKNCRYGRNGTGKGGNKSRIKTRPGPLTCVRVFTSL